MFLRVLCYSIFILLAFAYCKENEPELCEEGQLCDLQFSPNPVIELTEISFTSDHKGRGEIIMVDLNGRQIHRKTITLTQADNSQQLDLKNLQGGAYIVCVLNGGERLCGRLIKKP